MAEMVATGANGVYGAASMAGKHLEAAAGVNGKRAMSPPECTAPFPHGIHALVLALAMLLLYWGARWAKSTLERRQQLQAAQQVAAAQTKAARDLARREAWEKRTRAERSAHAEIAATRAELERQRVALDKEANDLACERSVLCACAESNDKPERLSLRPRSEMVPMVGAVTATVLGAANRSSCRRGRRGGRRGHGRQRVRDKLGRFVRLPPGWKPEWLHSPPRWVRDCGITTDPDEPGYSIYTDPFTPFFEVQILKCVGYRTLYETPRHLVQLPELIAAHDDDEPIRGRLASDDDDLAFLQSQYTMA